jgi:phosphomannomutase/phosphoglucomutase
MLTTKTYQVDPAIFRAYDIRGIVGHSLTERTVFLIGKAVGSLILDEGGQQFVMGRDGRFSSLSLANALCEGAQSVGCDIVDLGMIPTPLLYYGAHLDGDHSGVMITGSHNPPDYNGLKIVIKGKTLAEEAIRALYYRILGEDFRSGAGKRHELSLTEAYLGEMTTSLHLARELHVVVDAGNGVTGIIAPQLFRILGCKVDELFCEIDGRFPHHHPDPSDPANLQDLISVVREKKADIGLAFDGDGDRLGVVTPEGAIIWPDRLLMLFAKMLLLAQPQAKIIYDVKCTNHLESLIKTYGGEPIMWKTGHSLIKAKLIETNAALAGEMSGHFFFKHRWHGFDDALYAGARLLEIIANQPLAVDALFATIPNSLSTPELRVSVTEVEKIPLMQELIAKAQFREAQDIITLDGLRVHFANGWGLIRPSNTTPCLILRFEAANQAALQKIQALFREWMLSVKTDWVLPF